MKQNKEHISHEAIDRQSREFFAGGTFQWKRSKSDVWAEMETRLETPVNGRSLTFNFSATHWAVAASIALLIAATSFLRFYSVDVRTEAGQHLVVELPDRSIVNLNAQSSIKYHPYWWNVSRMVTLDGEAFFEVQKGKKFIVKSSKGSTQVLGTSFNIFSRDEVYKVTCVTGSVKVSSKAGFVAVLKPNSKAEIQADGKIDVQENIQTYPEISWKKNIFLFTASPAGKVFKEIERQYGIHIETKIDDYSLYTGNFTKDQNVEEILEYVCPALGLRYIRKSAGEYLVIPKEEE